MSVELPRAPTSRVVELAVPEGLSYQLIYRMQRDTPFAVSGRNDVSFHYAAGLWPFMALSVALYRVVGRVEWLRGMIRMAVGRRFYCVLRNGEVLHYGWANVAVCRHYRVGPREVVVGPIWSAPAARDMGLATYAMQQAINRLIGEGWSVFYIDTAWDNLACQKVIARCGFGVAMGCMPRRCD